VSANPWTKRVAAADRYESDPAFAAIVDVIYMHICEGTFTPTELREAVILAATKYEMLHARPMILGGDNLHSVLPARKKE
jgi:hypothetical protein